MARFTNYQDLENEETSKFWGIGKWNNYIAPYLPKPEDCKDLIYIDMGCNAGQFCRFAEDWGFGRVIGVDHNRKAINKGIKWRDEHGYHYDLQYRRMEDALPHLPVCDYISFINSHYYILVQDWLRMLDYMHTKTRYVIITSTRKKEYYCAAPANSKYIKRCFKHNWDLVGSVPQLPREGDPRPRSLSSMCFKSKTLERVSIDKLLRGHHIQGNFHEQIEKGVHPLKTRYFKMLCRRVANKGVPMKVLEKKMLNKVKMYGDIKKNGILEPIITNKWYRVLDGNHRSKILPFLGYKETNVRRLI